MKLFVSGDRFYDFSALMADSRSLQVHFFMKLMFFYSIVVLASEDKYETYKVYRELNRQDNEAAKTNTVPNYTKTGVVDMSATKGTSNHSKNSNSKKN